MSYTRIYQGPSIFMLDSILMVWPHLSQISLTLFSAFKSYTCVFIGSSFSNNHINSIIIERLDCSSFGVCILLYCFMFAICRDPMNWLISREMTDFRHRFVTIWGWKISTNVCHTKRMFMWKWTRIDSPSGATGPLGRLWTLIFLGVLMVCCKFSLDSLNEDWEHTWYTLFSIVASCH